MITLAWYLLKVIICSGILCGYYFLVLRNKAFHRWNRFYLLAAVVISLLVPIIKIDIFQNNDDKGTVVQMLQTISYGDEVVVEYSKNSGFQINTQNVAEGAYLLVSAVFLFIFFLSVYKIKILRKKFPETKIEDISFINTNAKGTPFSFFKSIFWNNAIDLHSRSGQQIFNHEIAHVKEKHSYDKIFMNLILIFFWINPFFWLMRKELYMIHEFIADKEALEDSDINAFAEMILQTVYPGQNFSIGNSFFYSPIKRRIMMLTKNKNPKVSYYSRLLVLPLAAIVFFAFTLKVKSKADNIYEGKTITVVIDAGHGGDDNGAHSANGLKEKDITLSIAKKVAALNSNNHINILLSRDNDQRISVKDRVYFAKNHGADLFVSIHLNAAVDEQLNGFSVLIDKNNSEKNQLLASALINELKATYKTDNEIEVRNKGLFVVDSNSCPAAVIQCGYITNSNDIAFISNIDNQEKIARNVLSAINNYASSAKGIDKQTSEAVNNENDSKIKDTIPNKTIGSGMFVDGRNKVTIYANKIVNATLPEKTKVNVMKAVIIINGKIEPNSILKTKTIHAGTLTIHSGDEKDMIAKYGEKARNGVFVLDNAIIKNETPVFPEGGKPSKPGDIIFTKVNVDAQFPGGPQAWQRYIVRKIQASIDSFTNADYGTCVIRFIVDVDGRVSDVQATTMKGTLLAKISTDAIKNGPKWIPAKQNGHEVAAYRLQPVTLQNPSNEKKSSTKSGQSLESSSPATSKNHKEVFLNLIELGHPSEFSSPATAKESNKVFVKLVEPKVFLKLIEPASFPGGQTSWLKYISRIFDKNGNELMADKNNEGTCKIRFLVNKEGKVSDVQPVTMKGTELADVAVDAIQQGPRWNPAKQNGHPVNSYVIAPVTFKLSDKIMNKNEPE
jgi:N-acetylmuramoyl-L-alanine amidase/outer membrane biosynthesis protein TonB